MSSVARIIQFLDSQGIRKAAFYLKTGLANGYLDKVKELGSSKIESIVNAYPEINLYWLVTGSGKMLRESPTEIPHEKAVLSIVTEPETQKAGSGKPSSVPPIVPPTVPPTRKKTKIDHYSDANIEPVLLASEDLKAVPIVDISVAAGDGFLNPEYMDNQGHISVPKYMLSKGFHLAVRNRGQSMEPVIADSSILIIRRLERAAWADMRDEEIYVVSDKAGTSWVKTVKNRLKDLNFLVLMSENPDKDAYPNFNVYSEELHNIWHVDCALQFRFRSAYRQYWERLKGVEDMMEEMAEFVGFKRKKKPFKLG